MRRRGRCERSKEVRLRLWEDVAEDLADQRDGHPTAEKGARVCHMLGFNRPGQWDVGAKRGFEKRGQAACCSVCSYCSPLLVALQAP